LLLSMLK